MKKFLLALMLAFVSTACWAGQGATGHTGYPYSAQQYDYFNQQPHRHSQQVSSDQMCELCSCKDAKDSKKSIKMNCCKGQCTTGKTVKKSKVKEATPASGDKEQMRH